MSTQGNRAIVHRVLEEFWQSYGENAAVIDELLPLTTSTTISQNPKFVASRSSKNGPLRCATVGSLAFLTTISL
jgi:hypothetical protein